MTTIRSKILTQSFFKRDSHLVARELLGKYLVGKSRAGTVRVAMITEVEVYDGWSDLASHARFGLTKRNQPMFKMGGFWYVYLVYGVHYMLNVVTGPPSYPAAILIRGVKDLAGPGRVTRLFEIDQAYNDRPISRASGLWIEDRGVKVKEQEIKTGPRVGVEYAGPEWSNKPWRLMID